MTEHTAQSTILTFTSFATFSTLIPKQTFQNTLKKKSILNAYILLPTSHFIHNIFKSIISNYELISSLPFTSLIFLISLIVQTSIFSSKIES